jgi:hypothetical protein
VTGGHHIEFVTLDEIIETLKLSFWNLFLSTTAIVFVKMSIVFTLLRIPHSFWWGFTLWMLNLMLVLLWLAHLLTVFLQCRPFSNFWNILNRAETCWAYEKVVTVQTVEQGLCTNATSCSGHHKDRQYGPLTDSQSRVLCGN